VLLYVLMITVTKIASKCTTRQNGGATMQNAETIIMVAGEPLLNRLVSSRAHPG
jgi:hypothetical protein